MVDGFAASRKCSCKEILYWDAARGSHWVHNVTAAFEFFFALSVAFLVVFLPALYRWFLLSKKHAGFCFVAHTPNPTKGGCHQKDPQLLAEHHGGWQSLQWVAMVPKLGASEPPVPKRSRDRRKAKVVILQDIATSVVFFWSRIWLESWSFAYCDEWNMSNWMNWSFFFRFPSCTLSCFFLRSHFERLSVVCGRSSCWRCWITRMWSNCFRHWIFIS